MSKESVSACVRVQMSQQNTQAEVPRQPYAVLLTVNYSSPREGLFSILKELTNQCVIIANEPPLNSIRVSIIYPCALQPVPSRPWVYEIHFATPVVSQREMTLLGWGQLLSSNYQLTGHVFAFGHFCQEYRKRAKLFEQPVCAPTELFCQIQFSSRIISTCAGTPPVCQTRFVVFTCTVGDVSSHFTDGQTEVWR